LAARDDRRVNPVTPTPALVTQRAVQRLPRTALLLFCAAYVLPGVFGRDPWRNADQAAFGYMLAMAEGRTPWLAPTVGGLPLENALLPHWLGAGAIALLSPMVEAPLAARLPFALLLALVLVLTWYATFQLARTEAAQPVAFAFGGEADMVGYARAMADGALLALIATLGLLQLGHETTPELVQLFAATLGLWSLAAAPYRHWRARIAALAAFALLAASGAPTMALLFGLAGTLIAARSTYPEGRSFAPWIGLATLLAAVVGALSSTWAWRVGVQATSTQVLQLSRLFLWFLWPAWLLVLWTLWRWRRHWTRRHVSVPLALAGVSIVACIAGGGFDRALMMGLPAFAVLAAFALPTLKRSATSAIDWFSVFAFSISAVAIWVIYAAMVTGAPAKTAANIAKLAPGFEGRFAWPPFAIAVAATLAWLALVRWRTGRHQQALWKSLVLPAGGAALGWLLVMTLWLPVLDYARSYAPVVQGITSRMDATGCVEVFGLTRPQIAALRYHGKLDVRNAQIPSGCPWLVAAQDLQVSLPMALNLREWRLVTTVRRPTDQRENLLLYKKR
jgi:4-amino-4-deoxy-L-arabinose transferase-like glycosyltransferase